MVTRECSALSQYKTIKKQGDVYKARNWWLRSPNWNNANNERNVNTSGAVNNNNARNANGVVPDCRFKFMPESSKFFTLKAEHFYRETSACLFSRELDRVHGHRGNDMLQDAVYFDKAIIFKNLYKAMKKSCNGARWKQSVIGYENNGLENTYKLYKSLHNGKYKIGGYKCFRIHEPKVRDIAAPRLPDKQFQQALCDAGLYDDMTAHVIRNTHACMVGRGTGDAFNRTKLLLSRYYRKHGKDGWCLKCDIKKFFPSTPHNVAKAVVRKYVGDKRAAQAVCDIIDSFTLDGDDVGIGLGCRISQLIELLVLNDLDHYIKEKLHIKYYTRYADDFMLVHPDKDYLQFCKCEIEKRLRLIGLTLNRKTEIQPLKHGITYLKWRFMLTDKGKVLMLVSHKKVTKQKERIRKLWRKEQRGEVRKGTTKESLISFLAGIECGNTTHVAVDIINYYIKQTGETSWIMQPKNGKRHRSRRFIAIKMTSAQPHAQ